MECNRFASFWLIALFVNTLVAGCAGVVAPSKYEEHEEQVISDMVPIRDAAKKFDFFLPKGWRTEPDDVILPDTLELPLNMKNETGRSIFTKENRGSMVVWCQADGQTEYKIEQSLYKISPSSKLVKGPVEVNASGWNPVLRRYDSAIVERGQKKGFSFFMATKSQKLSSLFGCNYVVVARSANLNDAAEIESDFVAVLKSLKN